MESAVLADYARVPHPSLPVPWVLAPKLIILSRKMPSPDRERPRFGCAVLCLVTQSCPILCDPMDCNQPCSSIRGDSPDKNTGVGSHALLQGIFPTQGSNPGLPHCRQILYHLSHQGSPWILEWIAYPFSRGSSWHRNWTRVSCMAGGFFTSWATRETHSSS